MKLKKLLGGLLAASMALSLAACGGGDGDSQTGGGNAGGTGGAASGTEAGGNTGGSGAAANGDMPVVKAAIPAPLDMTDAPMVQEEMNKILAEKYGIQAEFTFIGMGSWQQQTNLLLTGSDVDMIAYFQLPLNTFVSNGQCTNLDDYVANASDEFKALFTEEQMNGCKINGVQYAIPNLRNYGNDFIMLCDEAKLTELGYKAEDIKTMDDAEEVLYAAHEKYPDIYTVVPQSNATFVNGWTWDGLGDQNYIGVIGNCGQDTTVTDIFENPDFIEFCTRTHKWFEDGLMMGDALSNQETGTVQVQNGAAFAYFANSSNEAPPAGLCKSVIVSNWTDSTNISALTYGINPLSTNPDAAWTLLEALYTDTELMTLLIDGIEGTHYVMNDDGSCSYPEGVTSTTSTYGNATCYWAMPYALGVPPITDLGSPTSFDDLVEFNNASKVSKGEGFVLDTNAMGITDEYAACISVKDKYYNGLMNGILDPETVMAQAHQEMVDSGIEKICEAKQAALDELLK